MILALPIMPILLATRHAENSAQGLDWIEESLGEPPVTAAAILGKELEIKNFQNGDKIYGYKNPRSQWGRMTNYLGVRDDRVFWAIKSTPYLLEY